MSPLLALLAFQDAAPPRGPVHPKRTVIVVSDAPVTAREAREAFARAATLFTKVTDTPLGTPAIPSQDRPATRSEIVGEMARLYTAATPALRLTPAPTRHDAKRFRIESMQETNLDRLVTLGCVARVGPLAVGPQSGMTPKQFGDALGFFMARLAQMSHQPSTKYTPMLKGD